ncbi:MULTISPECIES: hypothetical protein [Pasteurellaceae]|uniref:Uncharacterized protein n=1 Tax=Pasteurella atlantica TaxID=2827233 RepID=A0AAW8CTG9_9PAST|nr:hypothetical protein [Pasteurella atlantica]MBR0573971.1 hypothetical protein [Pasteurella atlantica]MDP8039934.1 hypothetical protein [Pasteurella atlantica]MDP8042010.1 hypothetical protein [Pasteurella atlantica]MDP8044195.1 hypothetical protein [Pasteurella atlantica]MDP8046240.1 hypothetical protein [Pasteurella atlantica]
MKEEIVKEGTFREGCCHGMKILGLFFLLFLIMFGVVPFALVDITVLLSREIAHNINKYWDVSSKFTKYDLEHYSFLSSSLKEHSEGYIQPLLKYRFQRSRSYHFYCYSTFFKVPQDIVFNDLNWKSLTEIKGTINYKKYKTYHSDCADHYRLLEQHGSLRINDKAWLPLPFTYAKVPKPNWRGNYPDFSLLIKGSTENINLVNLPSEDISRVFISLQDPPFRGVVLYPKQHIIKVITGCHSGSC